MLNNNSEPMTIQSAFAYIQSELTQGSSQIDARYLLSYLLKKSFTWLKTWPDKKLTTEQQQLLEQLIQRRKKGEPIAYITGEKAFWTLNLKSNQSTLIPRPESELLVEMSLEFLKPYDSARVLDLGTGTGAIALAIATERKKDQITACDFQVDAVELAKKNAAINHVSNVEIFYSNWFSNVEKSPFHLIVSNPPYVAADDLHLKQGDLVFEPTSALIANRNGLSEVEKIITQAPAYLLEKGALIVEHGFQQADEVKCMFHRAGFVKIKNRVDLSHRPRATMGLLEC